ncbi:MAG: hypothetical protein LBS56_06980 [Propionibacteriaceae bacterium]|jgi:hypothetical protein|nr:hypothetical protein [Propionibacteriaceae bacterium]
MGVVVLFSAGGSPGVTTTAVGLALAWPRDVVLIEADPTGASGLIPGYLQGVQTPARSVIDLAIAHQQGHLAHTVLALSAPLGSSEHARFIPAVKTHRQAAAMTSVWEPLMDEFLNLDRAGTDVLVDAGRLGLEWFPTPLAARATASLLVLRCTLPAIAQARVWASWLAELGERHLVQPGLAVVGSGHVYPASEIGRYLKLKTLISLPLDHAGARVFSEGAPKSTRWLARSPLAAAFKSEAGSLAGLIAAAAAAERKATV